LGVTDKIEPPTGGLEEIIETLLNCVNFYSRGKEKPNL
jgi:hypothetical protein